MKDVINFKDFRVDFEKAVEELGKKYNLSIKAENITYNDSSFTLKVKAVRTDIDGEKEEFMRGLRIMKFEGFTEDDFKKEVVLRGKKYKILGFKPGRKYDVLTEREDGEKYYYVSRDILKALGRIE